jgi:glycogen debranching enzyme
VSARNGTMSHASIDGHGLWLGDTRFLSEYFMLINGKRTEPERLDAHPGGVTWHLSTGLFEITRERYLASGMHERITITNRAEGPEQVELELVFGADFAAMLAVRGLVHLPPRPPAAPDSTERGLLLQDTDGSGRLTEVVISPPGPKHSLRLAPGESTRLEVHVLPRAGIEVPEFGAGEARIRDTYDSWARDCAHFETDNPVLNELIEQSRDDMRMLCDRYPTGIYPTAGLPWFSVPFGRDALFTSMFALPMNPGIARGALKFLAAHQGKADIPETEEQPGKILHEVRDGEAVDSGQWPHILYGTVDATALFVVALVEAHDWTGDDALLDELLPAAERALQWCEEWGDTDGDGWIDYRGARARNQGWKDSDDSLTHTDGTLARNPAGLCEVQAYWYRALLGMARRKPELKARAEEVRRRFNRDFWMPREKFIAQALDGDHRQVQAITSNPGHCLWTSILAPARARAVSTRMMEADLWTGWGIRTLSDLAVNYDPCSYHNGSVWPHDCAIAAAGMRMAGCEREAEMLARMILEAGMAFPDRRLPELWCGTSREPGELPDDYRNSCSPQNWAAASVFSLLCTLLGLNADSKRKRLRIAPIPTPLFTRLEVTGLHFAGERLDFVVEDTEVRLGRVPSGVRVAVQKATA